MHRNYIRPNKDASMTEKLNFQKDKYITRKFIPKGYDDPVAEYLV